jgi:hypothetical protein
VDRRPRDRFLATVLAYGRDDEEAILTVIEGVGGVRIVDSRITVAAVEDVVFDRT